MSRTATGESSIARAIRILEAFTPENATLTVSQVARRADLPVSTASRLIGELSAHGLLTRGERREVTMGVRLWELASRASPALSLRRAALPYLEDLHAVVGHHAQLGVRDGPDVLFIERLSTPGAVVNFTRVAGRLPAHASASGHVLLAWAEPASWEHLLRPPLERYTSSTIGSAEELGAALELVRRQGYAALAGHLHPDATGLAAPVRNGLGVVVASIAVVVPTGPTSASALPAVLAAARGATRRLGRPPEAR